VTAPKKVAVANTSVEVAKPNVRTAAKSRRKATSAMSSWTQRTTRYAARGTGKTRNRLMWPRSCPISYALKPMR
jgi:hypothetical protein